MQPHMRCAAARQGTWDVVQEVTLARVSTGRAGGHSLHHRRIGVPVTQHRAQGKKFRKFGRPNALAHTLAHGVAFGGVVFNARLCQIAAQMGVVGASFFEHMHMHRATLALVTGQQRLAAPALQDGSQFPSEVHRVTHAHVHAKTTKGRVQVAGIARQKNAPVPVLCSDDLVCHPFVHTEGLVRQIDAGGPADQVGGVVQRHLHTRCQAGGHEEPSVIGVHRPGQAGHLLVDQPVHDGFAMRMGLRQPRCAKHDVVVAGHAESAFHSRTNGLARQAASPITTCQVVSLYLERFGRFQVAHGGHHAAVCLFNAHHFSIQPDLHAGYRI